MRVGKRDFRGRRWLSIALRTLHLSGVVLAGVGVVDGSGRFIAGVWLMLVAGAALWATDWWHRPGLWREVAGVFIALKAIAVLVMVLAPGIAVALFWVLLVSSSIVSHAPRAFRHLRVFG
jgi:hypothetical protein